MYKLFTLIIIVLFFSCGCGGNYSPGSKKAAYPDSVYGKAQYGREKFN